MDRLYLLKVDIFRYKMGKTTFVGSMHLQAMLAASCTTGVTLTQTSRVGASWSCATWWRWPGKPSPIQTVPCRAFSLWRYQVSKALSTR